ncbi:MAG: fimbrillin family protein [Prevotella sp.]|nr:fimbrillin family protein [Prevotella sp.]
MRKHIILSLCAAAALLMSCSSSESTPTTPTDNNVAVVITTDIVTRTTPAKSLFASGDAMNVWAKSYGSPSANDIVANIRANYNGSAWTLDPGVYLDKDKQKNAFIYAVYPYQSEFASTPGRLTIDATTQNDYLYSGSYVPVTVTTNTAKLNMKHAMSLAAFNIFTDGYSGAGKLQSLAISGDSVYTKGVMTVENGKIRGTERGEIKVAFDKQITAQGWSNSMPRIWVIPLPFNTKSTKAYLKAVIDGKEFNSVFPEVEMKIGFQYSFHLVLTDNGLEFIPDQTTTMALNFDEDEIAQLEGRGVLGVTYDGSSEFSSVVMAGVNVFGTVLWGDGEKSTYEDGISHTFSTAGSKKMIFETWNSTGFTIKNLTGISEIDISGYE